MKTKYIILIALTAIITLSFTFISSSNPVKTGSQNQIEVSNAPVGGLAADDSF